MHFGIKKNDPYLDFFKNQVIPEELGDPYDPIPQQTLDDRPFEIEQGDQNLVNNPLDIYGEALGAIGEIPFVKSAGRTLGGVGEFAKNALIHPIDTAESLIASPFASALSGVEDALRIGTGTPQGAPFQAAPYVQRYEPEQIEEDLPDPIRAGLKIGLPSAIPGSEVFAEPLGKVAEGNIQEGLGEIAGLGIGGALLHAGGKGAIRGLKEIPSLAEKHAGKLPFEYSSDPGMFKPPPLRKAKYQGQEVEVKGRRGNSVVIKLPDGTEKSVGFSSLDRGEVTVPSEPPKSKYGDLIKELEAELGDEGLVEPEVIEPDIPTIDPSDVSIVLPEKNILPEYGQPIKPGRPGKQGPPKPPKLPNELGGEGGESEGPKPEDWLKTAAREVPKIERAQSQEIIKDQGFRDQIKLQDEILKEQERDALKEGKAEEAHKLGLERKILRAQNEEVFQKFKKEEADKIKSEREQNALQNRILKEQTTEDLASRKEREDFLGRGEQGAKPQTPGEWLLDLGRVPIALKASGDIPALSHARYDTLAHPIQALKNLGEAGKAVFSPEKQAEVFKQIADDPMFSSAMQADLPFTKQGYDLGAQSFGSYTAENIPAIGEVVKASERGQNVFLDKTRMDRFKELMEKSGIDSFEQDPEGAREIAKAVGIFTGYGKLEGRMAEGGVRALNSIMWSARKRLARAQHLGLVAKALNPVSDMNPAIRKEIFRQAIPTITLGIGLLKMAQSAGAQVDWDLRNSNALKARFPTDSGKSIAWGPFGDYVTTVKLLAQQMTGTKITDKKEYDIDDPKGPFDPTRTSLAGDYLYNSLNPTARGIWDMANPRSEMEGSPLLDIEEYPHASPALELGTPINLSRQIELAEELGPVSSLFAPFTTTGEDIDVYDPDKFSNKPKGNKYSSKKKGKRKGKVLSLY